MYSNNNQTEKSLRFSFLDGIFASAMLGFTQDYFAPFLLILGATARHIGILSAVPNLFASLAQLKSADIVERMKSRRGLINIFVYLQAVMLLPLIAVTVLNREKIAFVIGCVTLFTAFNAIATPAWASIMSDLVKENKRGEYFGWRNKMLGFVTVATTLSAGIILHIFKKINIFYGFLIIFTLAFIFRIISWHFLTRMHEPPLAYHKKDSFGFIDFISRIKESNFAKFVIFVSMMTFSVNLASPFFAVLMLRDLHFSYFLYTVVTIASMLMIYIMISRWGKHADKVGNIKVIRFTSPLIGFIPLLWIINRNPIFLCLIQVFAGFLWAGFNLCASNFIYDAVTPEKRTRCISYFNVLNGLFLCCGALLGGFLLRRLPPIFGYKILTLFLISSTLRLAVSIFILPLLKEVRTVEHINNTKLFFSVIGIRPMLGIERKP